MPGVADGGDADPQGRRQVLRGLVEAIAERRLDVAHRVDRADDHVRVTVEQAGQHGLATQVDPIVAVQAGPDLDDAAVLHHDVDRRRSCARAVDDGGAREQGACHGVEATSAAHLR